jgi:tetratricopeptide (TPR) repeat protein
MWLVVFLFHLFVFDRTFSLRAKGAVLAICLCVLGAYAGLRHLPDQRPSPNPTSGWSAPVRGVLMLRALGDYGRLMVFPSTLYMERSVMNTEVMKSHTDWKRNAAADYLTIGGLLVLVVLSGGAARKGSAQRLRMFGVGWFLLAYLPISNIIELNATVAEHWLYLPSVGFLLFAAGVALEMPKLPRKLATAIACVAVVGFGTRSYARSGDWLNSEVFYTSTSKAGGGSIRVLLNLGLVYANREEYARAEALFRKSLEIYPGYVMARNNLADVLLHQGKTEEAERTFREASAASIEARKEFPRTWVAALNVAKMRLQADDTAGAIDTLEKAREDYPGVWRLISLESELVRKSAGPDAALPMVQEFAAQNWWHVEAALALGKLYAEKGMVADAERAFRHASRLDVHDVSALNQSALLCVNQQRYDEAYATQRRAIARQPDEPRQYLILSDILEKMGRTAEAKATLAEVSRMQAVAQSVAVAN